MIETIRLKIRRTYMKLSAGWRKYSIDNNNFTIISNNCWAGFIYQSYKMKYNTPTIGLFFMADDYINFLKNIRELVKRDIIFINELESKYYNHFKEWDVFGTYPIGKFKGSDIEIHFLHYLSEDEAKSKWNERVERINWNKTLFKFNDQNLCEYKHIKDFSELPYKNKICFTAQKYSLKNVIYIKSRESYVKTSYEPFGKSKYINLNKVINDL